MKHLKQVICIPALAILMAAGVGQVFAAESSGNTRVVEETLVLKDPTVSGSSKWVFGGALEAFYVHGSYKSWNANGVTDTGTINALKPGLNLFAGYEDVTVNYVYRSGTENVDLTNVSNNVNHTNKEDQKENEITVRWLIRALSTSFITPYVYAGYTDIKSNDVDTITTPGWVWTYNLSPVSSSTSHWKGGVIGIGGIIPVSEKLGLRVDGGMNSTNASFVRSDGYSVSGSGVGGRLTGTAYYNIAQGWNVQVGGRYEYLNGGNVGNKYRTGLFAMLGYSYK